MYPRWTSSDDTGMQDSFLRTVPQGVICYPIVDLAHKVGTKKWRHKCCGASVAHYEYDAYGNLLIAQGAAGQDNPFRFSTKYLDEEIGWYCYGYGYYSPQMGRWTTIDPLDYPRKIDDYCTFGNNPIRLIDAFGLESVPMEKVYREESLCGILAGCSKRHLQCCDPDSCSPRCRPIRVPNVAHWKQRV